MRPTLPARRLLIRALFPCLGLLAGCATVDNGYSEKLPFTEGVISDYQLTADKKKLLQYYVSDTIHLVRSASAGRSGITDGRLVSKSARDVDEVVVDGGTPGIVVGSGDGWVAVSFEPGTYLYFVSSAPRAAWLGDEYQDDRYYLYVPDWNGQSGTVRLGNAIYTATDDSYRAYLVIGRESFSKVDSPEARLPGRMLK